MQDKRNSTYINKINRIRKYFKRDKLYFELCLFNYEGYYIYIVINYIKKTHSYKLTWFDLDILEIDNINKYINYQYIPEELINAINKIFSEYVVTTQYDNISDNEKNIVTLKANINTKNDKAINISFNRYLPKELSYISELLIVSFNNMPNRLRGFLYELMAILTGSTTKYEYKEEFSFDLFKGNIDKIFAPITITRGKKYYENKSVKFLEKIEERYFAIVEGTEKYVVIIKYDDKEKRMQVYCSCPCEFYCKHIYAVILAIRNGEFNRFFKVVHKNNDESLLEKVMNFNFYLCLGVDKGNLEIINNHGEIEVVPILDANNECNWEVLEDTEDEQLLKEINDYKR